MSIRERDLVSVHTLTTTSPEKRRGVVDDGHLIKDLGEHGLRLVLSSKRTFTDGEAILPSLSRDGELSFASAQVDPDTIQAMHVRPYIPIRVAGSERVPMLNPNSLKELAGSKIELYRHVLHTYQVPTAFLSMEPGSFSYAAELIEEVTTPRVVLKQNAGRGGYSTRILPKVEALAWVGQQIEEGAKPHIVQPEIMFGPIPPSVRAVKGDVKAAHLIERAREEGLLSELRMFVLKRGDEHDTIPVLRIVREEGMPMQGQNDDYVDIELDDALMVGLSDATIDITDRTAKAAGDKAFVLGAVDFYFNPEGLPGLMEANFRSPELPTTNDTPIAGRASHRAVAKTLASMAGTVQ